MLNKINIAFLVLLLVAMATSPAFLLEEGNKRNNFLVGVMFLSPLLLLFSIPPINFKNILLVGVSFCVIFFPLLFHSEIMRWSTVFFTVLFCMSFMVYSSLLEKSYLSKDKYFKLCKILIYSYAIVLIVQQMCVFTGLPIFNLSNYDPSNPWKLNSLSSEPSQSVIFVTVLMYSYLAIRDSFTPQKKKEDKSYRKVWFSFLWVLLTSISASSVLCLFLILLYFFKMKHIRYLFLIIPFFCIGIWAFGSSVPFERAYNIAKAVTTMDEGTIMEADHSGSVRIVPMIICAKRIDLTNLEGWVGHGSDYVSTFLYKEMPGLLEGMSGGGSMHTALSYGVIVFALFTIFSLVTVVNTKDKLTIIFWIFMCNVGGINMQFTWGPIVFFYTNKFFLNQKVIRE